MSGYPQYEGLPADAVDLLKCEIDHLRQANATLLAAQDGLVAVMAADIVLLEEVNAQLLAALEAVAEDIADPDSDSWINKPVKMQVLRALVHAKEVGQ